MHRFKDTDVQTIVWYIRKHYKVFKHLVAFISYFNSNEICLTLKIFQSCIVLIQEYLESIREILTLFTIKKVHYSD